MTKEAIEGPSFSLHLYFVCMVNPTKRLPHPLAAPNRQIYITSLWNTRWSYKLNGEQDPSSGPRIQGSASGRQETSAWPTKKPSAKQQADELTTHHEPQGNGWYLYQTTHRRKKTNPCLEIRLIHTLLRRFLKNKTKAHVCIRVLVSRYICKQESSSCNSAWRAERRPCTIHLKNATTVCFLCRPPTFTVSRVYFWKRQCVLFSGALHITRF